MLKKILKGESCAACRLCCVFDRYDVWETPVFTAETCKRIRDVKPDAEIVGMVRRDTKNTIGERHLGLKTINENGKKDIDANLKHCFPIGMPTMVMQQSSPSLPRLIFSIYAPAMRGSSTACRSISFPM